VRIVEIAGPVGAGKSSLVEPLARALAERGAVARTLDQVTPRGRLRRLLWSFAFGIRHPRFVAHAARTTLASPIPWWHRRIIFGLAMDVGGRLLAARSRAAEDEWVIVDEGLVHRAVNLFAWRHEVPRQQVESYLATLSPGDALVIVQAPADDELERAMSRGLPKRLVGKSPEEVRAFVSRAREVVLFAAAVMERRGARLVRVETTVAPDQVAAMVADRLVGTPA
jgi:thymidylate kinase